MGFGFNLRIFDNKDFSFGSTWPVDVAYLMATIKAYAFGGAEPFGFSINDNQQHGWV